ncbi:Oxidoreductase, molybdopterin-binding domain-containing protein [Dactylonectria estremocensis]|uniref:Oxidoreductase, molybdopterin-binding domain-containing protein n=1 Tax=Dactylonectria estremocensis TaxID=1079267 RepID=A0A9P9EYW1_9HYPO|nr:Oxidoreductase, molybdopterin-binding domain-containing protein [Dactylonectria estremocensis]
METSFSDPLGSGLELLAAPIEGREREACIGISPTGFYIRHPPAPHHLDSFITPDEKLFQTIHMGAAVVDTSRWVLVVNGLVRNQFALTFDQLLRLPRTSITAFHECYGSPIKPPNTALWRIGNVTWTGVRLSHLLSLAQPLPEAQFVWSEGLDHGTFAGITSDRYQKDLPMTKALAPEVLVAYEMNGVRLNKERGGPVRLIVPGWFGTNMTKWLCRLTLQDSRAPGPYTTTFYNEIDPWDPRKKRPVWAAEVNSMIVSPTPNTTWNGSTVVVQGWAWSHQPVVRVVVSASPEKSRVDAVVAERDGFSWQRWEATLTLPDGEYVLIAQAFSSCGQEQPLSARRNHAHQVKIWVKA